MNMYSTVVLCRMSQFWVPPEAGHFFSGKRAVFRCSCFALSLWVNLHVHVHCTLGLEFWSFQAIEARFVEVSKPGLQFWLFLCSCGEGCLLLMVLYMCCAFVSVFLFSFLFSLSFFLISCSALCTWLFVYMYIYMYMYVYMYMYINIYMYIHVHVHYRLPLTLLFFWTSAG